MYGGNSLIFAVGGFVSGMVLFQHGRVPFCPVANRAVFGSFPRSPPDTSAPPAGAGPTPSPAPSAGAACWKTRTGT